MDVLEYAEERIEAGNDSNSFHSTPEALAQSSRNFLKSVMYDFKSVLSTVAPLDVVVNEGERVVFAMHQIQFSPLAIVEPGKAGLLIGLRPTVSRRWR